MEAPIAQMHTRLCVISLLLRTVRNIWATWFLCRRFERASVYTTYKLHKDFYAGPLRKIAIPYE